MKLIHIVIIIIIIIALYLIIFVSKHNRYKYDQIYNYDSIKHQFKTGDIIFFSRKKIKRWYNSIGYYFMTEFVGCEYGHVGIVIQDRMDKLFVLECVPKNSCASELSAYLNNSSIRIIDLETLIYAYQKKYDGFFAVKFISKSIPLEIINRNLKKFTNKCFEDRGTLFSLAVIDICISHEIGQYLAEDLDASSMMCGEFVHRFLHSCGVLKKYPSKIFWPHLFGEDDFLNGVTNVKYSQLIKFVPKTFIGT